MLENIFSYFTAIVYKLNRSSLYIPEQCANAIDKYGICVICLRSPDKRCHHLFRLIFPVLVQGPNRTNFHVLLAAHNTFIPEATGNIPKGTVILVICNRLL
jgi:hypothetical protein